MDSDNFISTSPEASAEYARLTAELHTLDARRRPVTDAFQATFHQLENLKIRAKQEYVPNYQEVLAQLRQEQTEAKKALEHINRRTKELRQQRILLVNRTTEQPEFFAWPVMELIEELQRLAARQHKVIRALKDALVLEEKV